MDKDIEALTSNGTWKCLPLPAGKKAIASKWVYKHSSAGVVIVAVYVDDIMLTGSDLESIAVLKFHFHAQFSIKDLGSLHYFFGFEIAQLDEDISMHQCEFTINT
ncbi:hypothetical protein LIER_06199 [Lithospermum erythrorhizon]|uniref:Reverse transcriptase Ty1/copia-type domain-containing protein n=1 Tax=Lithospermum erythrorhizon TaxID=34254 RepID=A0AAV3P569_LITER